MNIAIIGAGAAGCFCAAVLGEMCPGLRVDVFERGPRALAKVGLTGGGRCNLTNTFRRVESLAQVYPRGERLMKRLLSEWGHRETMQWFERHGVRLTVQTDECVFPRSQRAAEVVETLLAAMRRSGATLHTNHRLTDILSQADGFLLRFATPEGAREMRYDRVVVTTGGFPHSSQSDFLGSLSLKTEPPVPSLFTLRIDCPPLLALTGTVVSETQVMLAGTNLRASGPLLITHRGVSGTAILRLSSYAARHLAERNYQGLLCINWMGSRSEDEVREMLGQMRDQSPRRQMASLYPEALTARHWLWLLERTKINPQQTWADLGGRTLSRLASALTSDTYPIAGRDRFKEEFVTCGGVSLGEVQPQTLQSRRHRGLYFAGEVLDIDAVTGGFNLQAAWTMGHKVATSIAKEQACSI